MSRRTESQGASSTIERPCGLPGGWKPPVRRAKAGLCHSERAWMSIWLWRRTACPCSRGLSLFSTDPIQRMRTALPAGGPRGAAIPEYSARRRRRRAARGRGPGGGR